jgi:hypothetical protein
VDIPSDRLGDASRPFAYLNANKGQQGRRRTLLGRVRGDSVAGTGLALGLGMGRSGRGSGEGDIEMERTDTRVGSGSGSGSIPLKTMFKRVGSIASQSPLKSTTHLPVSTTTTLSPPTSPRAKQHQQSIPSPLVSSAYLPTTQPANQPMRKEAQKAFDTFLRPGSDRELNVTDEMRTRCRVALESSTHPDVVSLRA